ncbi:hypothetical protein HGRIS_010345 [Hohenbuehelia grisea]|uniref:Uncharacterized protein n=1 Tax=Hohenbuehelia grisea TaxID=104357 RepID=A0ABR3J4K9_9AGAR
MATLHQYASLQGRSRLASSHRTSFLGADSFTTKSASLYTTTTVGTAYGIGSTAGKAIYTLGKTVLRSWDAVVIGRRLKTIEARMKAVLASILDVPLCVQERKELQDMYLDLLEFSRCAIFSYDVHLIREPTLLTNDVLNKWARPGLYGQGIQKRALNMLLEQTGWYDVHGLALAMTSLLKAQPIELKLLIFEFLFGRTLDRYQVLSDNTGRIVGTYPVVQQPAFDRERVAPFLSLLTHVVSTNAFSCEIILEAGFLDAMYAMLSGNESDEVDWPPLHPYDTDMQTHLLNACAASLVAIDAHLEHRHELASHKITSLWCSLVTDLERELASPASHHHNNSSSPWDDLLEAGAFYHLILFSRDSRTGAARLGTVLDTMSYDGRIHVYNLTLKSIKRILCVNSMLLL